MGVLVAGLAVVALALMVWFQVRQVRRVARDRRNAVARAEEVLTAIEVSQEGMGYPTIRGWYLGHEVKAELIVDTLTLRQLPRLWLAVTVKRPTEMDIPVDIVLRPLSTDIVSPGGRFRCEHPPPPEWPAHLRIASLHPVSLERLGELEALTAVVHDERTKSVLLAPRGVRIVTELARGDVASHRVVRRPNFRFELDPIRLRRVLDAALDIADEARSGSPVGTPA